MPTYGRPALVQSSIACFLAQDHPPTQRRLLILDDAGQIEPQQGDGWTVWSTPVRAELLPAKYAELVRLDAGWADAFVIWDDDDIYLPWHLSAHAAALQSAQWSHPAEVWSLYTGLLELEPAAGRFWAAAAVRKDLLAAVQGFVQTRAMNFDQLNLGAWHRQGGEPGRPVPPSFVYGWGRSKHCSSLSTGPLDTRWYGLNQMMQTGRVGRLNAAMDSQTKKVYHALTSGLGKNGYTGADMVAADLVPAHEDGLQLEEMAGESLLYSDVTNKTVYLNDTASAIWKLCDGTRSVEDLVALLREAYGDAEHNFEADVRGTIDELLAQGALRWKSVEPATR
jgi:hypothetical protein